MLHTNFIPPEREPAPTQPPPTAPDQTPPPAATVASTQPAAQHIAPSSTHSKGHVVAGPTTHRPVHATVAPQAPVPAAPQPAQIQIVQGGGVRTRSNGMPRVVLFIAIGVALIAVVWIFADVNPFVLLSSVWSGAMILLSKLGGFFRRGDGNTIDTLQDRLDEVRERERELIEVLKEDRRIFKERLTRLEGEGRALDVQIARQQQEVNRFETMERWQAEVWNQMTPEQQAAEAEVVHGQSLSLEAIRYQYDDV